MTKKTNEFLVIYTSPAFPPDGLRADITYKYGKDSEGDYLYIDGEKIYKSENYIKTLFSPLDGKW